MPSNFDRLWAATSPTFDRVFGDAFVYIPMTLSAARRPTPDASRAELAIVAGLFETPKTDMAMEGKRVAANTASPLSSSNTVIDFPQSALPYEPREGDRIRHRDSGAIYEIAAVRPDGAGVRIACIVIRKVSQP